MSVWNLIGRAIGTVIAITVDVAVFGAVAAIPLAALLYIGIIGQTGVYIGLGVVAVLSAMLVIIRSITQ